MILKFFIFVTFVTLNEVSGDRLSTATLEEYPYIAIVKGKLTCTAVLISDKHVLIPAQCVSGVSEVTVFLGNRYFPSNTSAPQSYKSSIIYIHENFQKISSPGSDDLYDDNIAIIEMNEPISQSSTIRPGKLISVDTANELNVGAIVGEVGWFLGRDTLMQGTLVMRSLSTCAYSFGPAFSSSKAWCFQEMSSDSLSDIGNVMTVDSLIAGLLTTSNSCIFSEMCTLVFINLAYYSDWISKKVQTSYWTPKIQGKSTSHFDTQDSIDYGGNNWPFNSQRKSPSYFDTQDSIDYGGKNWPFNSQRKSPSYFDLDEPVATDYTMETLAKTVKETNKKYECETANINVKLEKILNAIENMKKSQNDMFDYKIQKINDEIDDFRTQKDKYIDERDSKYDQKFQEAKNNSKLFERKFYEKIKEVNIKINDEISQNLKNLEEKLERQKGFYVDLSKKIQKMENEIIVRNGEKTHYNDLKKEINELKTEINTIKTDQVTKDDEIEQKLKVLRDHASDKHNKRLDDFENQINALSVKMGSMNTTLNEILVYIGKSPIPS